MSIKINLATFKCGKEWVIDDVDFTELTDACPSLTDINEIDITAAAMGAEGIAAFDTNTLTIEWDISLAAAKGACVELEIIGCPDDTDSNTSDEDCPDGCDPTADITDCSKVSRIALLNDKGGIEGSMSFDTFVKCIAKNIDICDILPEQHVIESPTANFELLGVKECKLYKIKSTDMCCEPKPSMEPNCD